MELKFEELKIQKNVSIIKDVGSATVSSGTFLLKTIDHLHK